MENLYEEFRKLALKFDTTILTPKAPPMTEREKLEYEMYMADPNRFIDYIGLIR